MGGFTNYSWIDNPLLDGMDYFAGIFFYFHRVAGKLAYIVALIGIFITAIKLMFGATTVKKAAVNSFFGFMFFIAAMHLYNLAVGTIAKTATTWGMESGGGKRVVENNLVSMMKQAEHDLKVANAVKDLSPAQAQAYIQKHRKFNVSQQGLGTGRGNTGKTKHGKKEESSFTQGLTDSSAPGEYMNEVNLYRSTEDNIKAAQSNIEALREVLAPAKIRDKNGDLIDTYFLNIMISDRKGVASNFISPAAFLKVSILLGKMLWQRECNYMTVKMGKAEEENEKNGSWYSPNFLARWAAIDFTDIGHFLLLLIVIPSIVASAIFILMQYCMCIFEYAIVTSILIVFVPFVLCGETQGVAKKILPAFWGFSIKLLILNICMFFSLYMFVYICANQMGETNPVDLSVASTILFTIALAFVVTQSAPQIAMSILTGQPQLSSGELLGAVGTMAAGAGGAIAGAKMAKSGLSKTGKVAGGTIDKAVTGAGMIKETASAMKTASAGIAEKGGSRLDQLKGAVAAGGGAVGGHIKNAAQNALHRMSHASMTKDNQNTNKQGSTFMNRFSGDNGKAPNTSFAKAKNFDAKGRAVSSQTAKEYMANMGNAGAQRGAAVAASFKPPKPRAQHQNILAPPERPSLLPPDRPSLPPPKGE